MEESLYNFACNPIAIYTIFNKKIFVCVIDQDIRIYIRLACPRKSRAEVPWALFMNIAKYFRNFENSNERRPHKFWTKALNSDLSDVSAFR